MVQYGQVWSSLVIAGPVCYRLVHAVPDWSSPGWSSPVRAVLVWSSLAQPGPGWSMLVESGQGWSMLVQSGTGWSRQVQADPDCSTQAYFRHVQGPTSQHVFK